MSGDRFQFHLSTAIIWSLIAGVLFANLFYRATISEPDPAQPGLRFYGTAGYGWPMMMKYHAVTYTDKKEFFRVHAAKGLSEKEIEAKWIHEWKRWGGPDGSARFHRTGLVFNRGFEYFNIVAVIVNIVVNIVLPVCVVRLFKRRAQRREMQAGKSGK